MNNSQINTVVGEETNTGFAPFSDKLDTIKDIVLNSVDEDVIKKVYLFGSYAYGEPNEDSDIDLCVVIGDEYKRMEVYMDIAVNLFDNNIIPCDVIVYNENEFHGNSDGRGLINNIINKGDLLYGK